MSTQNSISNNLLQQLIYIGIELPTKLVVSGMYNITSSIRSYTQLKPMLSIIDYILFFTSYRLHILGNYTDDFSKNTNTFIRNILLFNSKLFLCITTSLIRTGKSCRTELNTSNTPFMLKRLSLLPITILRNIKKTFNTDFNNTKIITSDDFAEISYQIKKYLMFCFELSLAFFLIPAPVIRSQKMTNFTKKLREIPENKVNIALRSSSAVILFGALYYIIQFKADLIDHSITAATHFVAVTMLTVVLTAIIVGPSKGLIKFIMINITWAALFCWQCSPIIIALS
jgi:hypothetical protein